MTETDLDRVMAYAIERMQGPIAAAIHELEGLRARTEVPAWLVDVEMRLSDEAWEHFHLTKQDIGCQCWTCRCVRGGRQVDRY